MKNPVVTKFCRKVGRQLRCSSATKHTLLEGLAEELSDLPDGDTASLAALEARVGSAGQIAAELQFSIPPEEESQAVQKKRRKTMLIIGGVLALSLIVFLLAILIFLNAPFYIVETIQEG